MLQVQQQILEAMEQNSTWFDKFVLTTQNLIKETKHDKKNVSTSIERHR